MFPYTKFLGAGAAFFIPAPAPAQKRGRLWAMATLHKTVLYLTKAWCSRILSPSVLATAKVNWMRSCQKNKTHSNQQQKIPILTFSLTITIDAQRKKLREKNLSGGVTKKDCCGSGYNLDPSRIKQFSWSGSIKLKEKKNQLTDTNQSLNSELNSQTIIFGLVFNWFFFKILAGSG